MDVPSSGGRGRGPSNDDDANADGDDVRDPAGGGTALAHLTAARGGADGRADAAGADAGGSGVDGADAHGASVGVGPCPPPPTAAAAPPARHRGVLASAALRVELALRATFYAAGLAAGRRPAATVLAALAVAAAAAVGLLRFTTETRSAHLWLPQGTAALRDGARVEAAYGRERLSPVLLVTAPGGGDVATRAGLRGMAALIRAATQVAGYDAVCARAVVGRPALGGARRGPCVTVSPLGAFVNASTLRLDASGGAAGPPATLLVAAAEARLAGLSLGAVKATLAGDGSGGLASWDGHRLLLADWVGGGRGAGAAFSATSMVVRLLLAPGTPPDKAAAFEEAWTRRLLAPDAPPVNGATGVISWVGESEWASLTAF